MHGWGLCLTKLALDGWYAPRPQAVFWLVILFPRGVWLSPPASNTNRCHGIMPYMNIKSPPVYDVSAWKEILDFTLVNPRPLLFITKATEGASFVDSKFVRFFQGMASIGVARGVYHFHRKAYDAVRQANHFINTIRGHITDKDLLILDVEEGGESALQLKTWLDTVRAAFPRNRLLIYSAKWILDSIPMTAAQKTYFKQIDIWIAGYPYLPDLWSYPTGYIPDQTKWGKVVLWQYSDKGVVSGVQGSVDLNWIDPVFAATIETLPPITTPPVVTPPTGESNMLTCTTTAQVKVFIKPNGAQDGSRVIGAGVTFNAFSQEGDWLHITAGGYVNVMKNGARVITVINTTPPPPPVETSVIDRIDVTINGVKYFAVNVPLNKVV